jgi:hypothetical protein
LPDGWKPETGIGLFFTFEGFSDPLKNALKLELWCNDEDLDLGTEPIPKTMVLTGEPKAIANNNKDAKLDLDNKYGNGKELEFNALLSPTGNSGLMELKNVVVEEAQTLEIEGTVEFFLNWSKAQIDITGMGFKDGKLNDFFPENPEEKPEDKINLEDMVGKYLKNFYFSDLDIRVVISGPKFIADNLDLQKASVKAKYTDADGQETEYKVLELEGKDEEWTIAPEKIPDSELFRISGGRKIFPYKDLKNLPCLKDENNKDIGIKADMKLGEIFAVQPKDLYFEYSAELGVGGGESGTAIITPADFDHLNTDPGEEKSQLSFELQAMALVPLEFTVADKEAGFGEIRLYELLEGDQKDLFGRASPDDPVSLLSEIKITKMPALHVGIEFPASFFTGGTLHLFAKDESDIPKYPLFPKGIPINGKSIKIKTGGKELNEIMGLVPGKNGSLLKLYPLLLFEPGKGKIAIPRKGMGLSRIEFGLSGDYMIEADELGK